MVLLMKILGGLVFSLTLAGIGFYLWMWWAWTPKPPKPSEPYMSGVVKEGIIGQDIAGQGVSYAIHWEAPDPQSPKSYMVDTWLSSAPEERRNILYVEGNPTPVDVKITEPGFIEVYFDGPLSGGADGMRIGVDENYTRYGQITVINGKVRAD